MKLTVGIGVYLLAVFVSHSVGQQTCCPDIGCISNEPPYDTLPPPDCPANVVFKLHTRANPGGQAFTWNTVPYGYSPNRRTVFIIHPIFESANYLWVGNMKDAFLQKEDANVITVDWSKEGATLYVPKGASNGRAVGMLTAKVIQTLLTQPNSDAMKFWCVGFSSAAHLCGYIGMALPAHQKLGRITGLSPDGPGMDDISDMRIGLNPSCAHFVEVIHTDSSHVFGTTKVLGHQDSYFTGHEYSINLSLKNWANFQAPVCEPLCQHRYALNFFTSSINQPLECFATSTHCTSENSCMPDFGCWAYAGYYADRSCRKTGQIKLKIATKEPYCSV